MDTVRPAGVLQSDGHGRLEGAAGATDEFGSVRGAGQAEEEGASHVNEDDADKDLADGAGDGNTRVLGLGGGNGDGFDAGVEGRAEDEDGGNAAETVSERTGVVPVFETNCVRAFNASRYVTVFESVRNPRNMWERC